MAFLPLVIKEYEWKTKRKAILFESYKDVCVLTNMRANSGHRCDEPVDF